MSQSGRQLAMLPETKRSLISCAVFRLWCEEGSIDFSELSGITSAVESQDYVATGRTGSILTRRPGRRTPPTISLKRAMRSGPSTTWVWSWHQLTCRSLPGMYRDVTLSIYSPDDDPKVPAPTNYLLVSAFPTKIELTGGRAGSTDLMYQNLTIVCEDMLDGTAF
jgi:hypothetical protein